MPVVLSQILDRRTVVEPRRLRLFDSIHALRAFEFYLTHEDLRFDPPRFPPALRRARLTSVRVFLPPYAPRTEEGEYLPAAFAEVDAAIRWADHVRSELGFDDVGLAFHHVTEWPIAVDSWSEERLRARLDEDRALGLAFVEEVAGRCLRRGIVPVLENVAPVRNDHAVPGARLTPRYETGFCGPGELRAACDRFDGLRVALDVCHLALGNEAQRAGHAPRINTIELDGDSSFYSAPPYDFSGAVEKLGPCLACVHLSGCAGDRKEVHEGGVPGEPGDTIDHERLLRILGQVAGRRELPVAVELRDAHTDEGFAVVGETLLKLSHVLDAAS